MKPKQTTLPSNRRQRNLNLINLQTGQEDSASIQQTIEKLIADNRQDSFMLDQRGMPQFNGAK